MHPMAALRSPLYDISDFMRRFLIASCSEKTSPRPRSSSNRETRRLDSWRFHTRWRWKFLVEGVVALPIVLPPTVLGFYLLIALGPRSPLGRWWQALTGHTLAFTFEGLVIGSIIYSLPFAVQPFSAAFGTVDCRLLAASATLGASRLRTFFHIILPLSMSGLVTGAALSFAHTMGEFGVVLMVGGNIPGVTRTVSIDIYDRVQAFDYSTANTTAIVLLAISFTVLPVIYALNRSSRLF